MQNIEKQILAKIKKAKRCALFFCESFTAFGTAKAVNKALERLVNSGQLDRIATGIYARLPQDEMLGKLYPDIDEIAKAIARRDRAKIVPTGSYALNRLGLSAQVPMNVIYLTDGAPRKIKVRQYTVVFKKTTPKNVSAVGEISRLVIQALRTLGKEHVTDEEIKHIRELLKHEKATRLERDIRLAPAWIREIMKPALENKSDD
jgi:hypothetical protein